MRSLPGPGDAATWPAYSGHPGDPRAPEGPREATAEEVRQAASDLIDRALKSNNPDIVAEWIADDQASACYVDLLARRDIAKSNSFLRRLVIQYLMKQPAVDALLGEWGLVR